MVHARNAVSMVVFEIGGNRFALPVEDVVQIVRAVAVTPLPLAPQVVEGVIDLHGLLVPVLDLRRRYGLAAVPVHVDEHFIAARAGERTIAFRADPRTRLVDVDADDIEDVSRVVGGTSHLSGMARLPDGVVLIQDLRVFLSSAESNALDAALASALAAGVA